MRSALLATPVALLMTAAASAQPATAPTPASPTTPGVVAPTPGATGTPAAGTYSPTGRPADKISNDSSAAGNAGQPSRVVPQGSGGSGNR